MQVLPPVPFFLEGVMKIVAVDVPEGAVWKIVPKKLSWWGRFKKWLR